MTDARYLTREQRDRMRRGYDSGAGPSPSRASAALHNSHDAADEMLAEIRAAIEVWQVHESDGECVTTAHIEEDKLIDWCKKYDDSNRRNT